MRRGALGILIAACVLAVPATFAEPAIDVRADDVVRQMMTTLDEASTLSLTAETTVDQVLVSGQKVQSGAMVSVLVRRPDRVLAVRDGDQGVREFAFDGKVITLFDPGLGLFATADAPGSITDALEYLRENFDLVLPLGDLIQKGLYDEIRPRLTSGRYVGRHRVGRVPCHHVAFTMDNLDWQLWIEDGPKPLPRKMVVTYKNLPGSPQFTAVIGEWRLSEAIPDEALLLVIPEDASRIDILAKDGGE